MDADAPGRMHLGELAFDGPVHEAITRYRRALAEDGEPADEAHAPDPAGTGEARFANVQLVGSDGEPRSRFLAGEPFGLEIQLSGASGASTLHLELRDGSGLLVAEEVLDPRALGANGADLLSLRFDVSAPPLQFGRFDVGLAIVGDDGRLMDRLPRGVPLVVYPDGEGRGLVHLEGTWRRNAKDAGR